MLYFQHAVGPEAGGGGEMTIQTAAFEVEYLDLRGQAVLVDTGAEVEVDQKPPPNIIKVQLPPHALPPPPTLPRTVVTTQPATTVTVVQPVKKKPKQQKRYK